MGIIKNILYGLTELDTTNKQATKKSKKRKQKLKYCPHCGGSLNIKIKKVKI